MEIPDRYSQEDIYITNVVTENMLSSKLGITHIYVIEKARPPTDFEENYHRLPPTVDFERIVSNVVKSLSHLLHKLGNNRSEDNKSISEKFKFFLLKEENKAIVSDSFWYAICILFKPTEYPASEKELKKRIAKNYMSFMLEINPEIDSFKSKEND
jgi:hypothetical protein